MNKKEFLLLQKAKAIVGAEGYRGVYDGAQAKIFFEAEEKLDHAIKQSERYISGCVRKMELTRIISEQIINRLSSTRNIVCSREKKSEIEKALLERKEITFDDIPGSFLIKSMVIEEITPENQYKIKLEFL